MDEGEFDVRVTAPEGTSLTAMNEWPCRSRRSCARFPACAWCWPPPGSGFLGGVNSANFFVQLAPHEERTFRWGRLLHWPPWQAFQGNFTQRDVQQEIRRRLRKLPDVRVAVRNPQTFVGGGPNFDIDFALLGPDLDMLNTYAERLRTNATDLGLLDADTTLKLDKPELRVEIDRDRAANLGVRHHGHCRRAAHHGGRRRARHPLPRRVHERGLRRAGAAQGGRPQRRGAPSRACSCRARAAAWCAWITW